MTYCVRRFTITGKFGIFWGTMLVEDGFTDRSSADTAVEWYQAYHPKGPANTRQVVGWTLAS